MSKVREERPQVTANQGKITTKEGKGLRVYLASPFFSEEQIAEVERLEQALISNPHVSEVFSPMRNQIDSLEFGSLEWRQAIFENDVTHIDWADVVVAVHDYFDDKTDAGTAWEMGYTYAKGKPVFLLQEKKGVPVNLMLSESIVAYFVNADEIAEYDFTNPQNIRFYGEVF
ncbi:nucleoside 2-deoxyribosyltransferase [Bacillus safensis]|uniref:nucleoside 2-deoxyribosyltransferase n=1 Tax=Bacillus safensis TaxID=561879 RepID=UPI001E302789|nr:nucleoside 2-deoxyribosyltransferase [Bacillus safensis]